MLTLDKTRPYGEIAGYFENDDPMFGAVQSQDGFLFDAQDNLVEKALTPADRKRMEELVARNDALDAARARFMEIAPNTDPAQLAKIISVESLNKTDDDDEVDLVAWAYGRKAYNYGKVAKAFRDRFSQSPVNKKQGLEILAEHGLIPPPPGAGTIPSQQ
jgi:hypothetical protein